MRFALRDLEKRGFPLPPRETVEKLTAKDLMGKIQSFYNRLEKVHSDIADFAEGLFLGLLADYPVSMCSRNLTETCKLLITVIYLDTKPDPEEEDPVWDGYSYEDLSIVFDRSKASLYAAVREKETQVKQQLEQCKLRAKAKAMALEEMVKEEKRKLLEEKTKGNETNKRTNVLSIASEDIYRETVTQRSLNRYKQHLFYNSGIM